LSATYRNPVWPHSFPDPFVLKCRGEYWAYCTGFQADGRCFGVLRSRDLVHWREEAAGALAPLPGGFSCYWAPEVVYDDGLFYLYYSVGDEATMRIRVAVSDRPQGPFEDSGRVLTSEPFAIDAHVFVDQDGSRHLFYATDFLERSHVGTGTVRDRMLDPFTLEGRPTPVALPRHDWHVYHPNRPEKGFVRWHTVEGPFVLERKGLYYEMFSAGNWQNPTYGVSFAVSDRIDRPDEWEQAADGIDVSPILRSIEGVPGPGHNSVVRGPDNRGLVCVYHRWASTDQGDARVMAIDPLEWAGERMLVLGPTSAERPAPSAPTFADFFDGLLEPGWELRGGEWTCGGGALVTGTIGEARRAMPSPSFLLEVSARANAGVSLLDESGETLFSILPEDLTDAWHLFRIEVDGPRVEASLDGVARRWTGLLARPCRAITLVATSSAAFSGFAVSAGFEDLFLEGRERWEEIEPGGSWTVEGRRLVGVGDGASVLARGPELDYRELTMAVRLDGGEGGWLILPAISETNPGPRLAVIRAEVGWMLGPFALPEDADPCKDSLLQLRRDGGRIAIEWEGHGLGEIEAPSGPVRVGIGTDRARAAFDGVRVTA
jgi:GH43 family beta-xylosidase